MVWIPKRSIFLKFPESNQLCLLCASALVFNKYCESNVHIYVATYNSKIKGTKHSKTIFQNHQKTLKSSTSSWFQPV